MSVLNEILEHIDSLAKAGESIRSGTDGMLSVCGRVQDDNMAQKIARASGDFMAAFLQLEYQLNQALDRAREAK